QHVGIALRLGGSGGGQAKCSARMLSKSGAGRAPETLSRVTEIRVDGRDSPPEPMGFVGIAQRLSRACEPVKDSHPLDIRNRRSVANQLKDPGGGGVIAPPG